MEPIQKFKNDFSLVFIRLHLLFKPKHMALINRRSSLRCLKCERKRQRVSSKGDFFM